MDVLKIPADQYVAALTMLWDHIPHNEALTDARTEPLRDDAQPYVLVDGMSHVVGAFVVNADGELVGVWAQRRGMGDALVSAAVSVGATHLDCFDGYLPTLYARHGFIDYKRESNWTAGAPDVVYMQHTDNLNARA